MATIKKTATDIRVGEEIRSPFTSGIRGVVERISYTEKKITFHIVYTAHPDGKQYIGHKWAYSFFKTTKIVCIK